MTEGQIEWPLPFASPKEVGMCIQRCARIERSMQKYVDDGIVAGLISVVTRRGRIAHQKCYGMNNIEENIPMRDDALFRIYSMSKIICAVTVLSFHEEGAFLLEDPISEFIPQLKRLKVKEVDSDGKESLVEPRREITIHDLLVHLSGLTYEVPPHDTETNSSDWIEALCDAPLVSHPGEKWHYSVANDVLGVLLETISGKDLDHLLKERVFEPLGMIDTDFYVPAEKKHRLAEIYSPGEEGGLIASQSLGNRDFFKRPGFFSLGGGLVSSTRDYLRFAQMLLGNGTFDGYRILSRKSVELMSTNQLPAGHPTLDTVGGAYGLGVGVLKNLGEAKRLGSAGEFGWGGAACTQVWIDPAEEMVAMVMLQHRPGGPFDLMKRFRALSCQAIID